MIRKLERGDKTLFLTLLNEFYHSSAVLHPIPEEHYARTFDAILADSPYLTGYIVEKDGEPAGYAQISFTWSTEAGGLVVWAEELYIRPQFQGKGLGQEFFRFMQEEFGQKAARIRLEVEPDNTRARALYSRLGYRELGYLQMYWEHWD